MTIQIKLTDTQRQVLEHAIDLTDGHIAWFPDGVRGGAQKKVIDGLSRRSLIATDGTNWFIAAEAYDALGLPRPGPILTKETPAPYGASQILADEIGTEDPTDAEIAASNDIDLKTEAAVTAIEAKARAEAKTPRSRENSKQAQVIAMLKRPEGATISQIMESTGWQAHTVRGTFAGAFKKKLGLDISSAKGDGERVYRIAG